MQTYQQMGPNRAEMEVAEPVPQNRTKIFFHLFMHTVFSCYLLRLTLCCLENRPRAKSFKTKKYEKICKLNSMEKPIYCAFCCLF